MHWELREVLNVAGGGGGGSVRSGRQRSLFEIEF